jgi:hypothetical protein
VEQSKFPGSQIIERIQREEVRFAAPEWSLDEMLH